jgi:DNA-binding beta-propeller fold protein YncE
MNLHTDRVRQRATLSINYDGHLLLAGETLYLHRPWSGELYALDRGTLSIRETLSDVKAIAYDGTAAIYALTIGGLARLAPDPLARPLETPFDDTPIAMRAAGERIYLLGYQSLQIFSRDLTPRATLDLEELGPRALAMDSATGQLYVGCENGLYALDTATDRLAPIAAPVKHIQTLVVDRAGANLYALARRAADWFGGYEVVAIRLNADGTSGETRTLFVTLDGLPRDLLLDEKRERLLIAHPKDHALTPIDLRTGEIAPRLPVGLEVVSVIVDEARERLYVSDSAGWVHVLDRQTYDPIEVIYGGRQVSLDAAHGWLYAGDPRVPVVTVYDAEMLVAERQIPQSGVPRADPANGQVVIVNRRFHIYDAASGELREELMPGVGQPAEECPGCYYTTAKEVTIDVRRGLTATQTYTPWPGKPGPSESIAYDPDSGRAYYSLLTGGYVHYSSIATYPDLGQLQDNAPPVLTLEGLSGHIALDPAARQLYVGRWDTLFVLDSETLNRVGRVHTDGWTPIVAAVDGDLGRLYIPYGGILTVWTRAGGAGDALLPPERTVVTKTVAAIQPSPNYAQDHTLLATIDGKLCRSTDGGETWVRLRGGLPEFEGYYTVHAAFSPDYAVDGTLFAAAYVGDTHGEGVYRSKDGGETWQLSSDGLRDLRVTRFVPSPRYARDRTLLAYARTQSGEALYRSTDGGETWSLLARQAQYGTPPLPRPEDLFYAESHPPRFRCNYESHCERSDDGGKTWTDFDTAQFHVTNFVAYALSPHYDQDGIVYLLTQGALLRYNDRTGKGEIVTGRPLYGPRDYTNAYASIATAATGDDEHALFISSHGGEFYRYAPDELNWEVVWPLPAKPAQTPPTPTPTPCVQDVDVRLQVDDTKLSNRLGCATEPAHKTAVAVQPFQRGLMFWRQDVRHIYVLSQNGMWADYADTWDAAQPERDPNLAPPEGLYQPMRGFGKVWRESLGGTAAAIGWATAQEHGFGTVVQPFTNGLLIKGEGGLVYALYHDGSWEAREIVER